MHINVKDFQTFHLLSLREPWKLAVPRIQASWPGPKILNYFYHQDLNAIIIGLCLCNGGTHTGIITNKVEFNFKIISDLNSVWHMTEKSV